MIKKCAVCRDDFNVSAKIGEKAHICRTCIKALSKKAGYSKPIIKENIIKFKSVNISDNGLWLNVHFTDGGEEIINVNDFIK